MTLADAFENFIRSGKYLKNWSPKTERSYRQSFSSFQQSLGTGDMSQNSHLMSKAQLEAWVVWMREKGMSPSGCNVYIRGFNSFLTYLNSESLLQQPLRLKLFPNPSKPLQGFSDIEIRSLLSFRPKGFTELRTWTLINALLDTGCRIEELLTLGTTKIDLDSITIRVLGKGNKERLVPISLEFRKTLYRFLKERSKYCDGVNITIFCTRDGHKLSYRNTLRDIKWLCAKAGVSGSHVHPHAFRHCFAVTYVRRGGDLYRLSRILGHTSVSTTQLYLRSMGIEQIGENHSSLSPLCRNS